MMSADLDPSFSIQIITRVLTSLQNAGLSNYWQRRVPEKLATFVDPGKVLSNLAVVFSRGSWAQNLSGFEDLTDEGQRTVSFFAVVQKDGTHAFLTRRSVHPGRTKLDICSGCHNSPSPHTVSPSSSAGIGGEASVR